MKCFDQLPLLPNIQKSLESLGFTTPTEIQAKIIPMLVENYKQDVQAQAQTGTGKTLAFGIPLLHAIDPSVHKVQSLIMAPTRELVLQIYESLKDVARGTGITIEPIYGGMSISRQIDSIKRGVHIIVGTPGRINDHLRRKSLKLNDLKILVLDEADIMLDMGFRQELDTIFDHAPKDRHIWLFSATVMSGIKKLIKSHMHDVVFVKSAESVGTSTSISQYFCIVPPRKRIEATARFIESAPNFNGIIFCRTKSLTTEVTEELASRGFKVNCLHGDMKQSLRNHVIKGFKNKEFTILVATDVAARGIDVSDLSHVINYSIPDDHESYIHRIGRTGRAGKEGIAILFISPSELHRIKRLEKITKSQILEITVPPVDAIINVKMNAVADFIEQSQHQEKKESTVDQAIRSLVNSFSPEELQSAFQTLIKDRFFQGLNDKKKNSIKNQDNMPQEIGLHLGSENGIDEGMIRSYLYTICKLVPQEVGKVKVLRNRTFIFIPENRLDDCLTQIRKNPLNNKKVRVYVVDQEEQSSKRPPRKRKRLQRAHRKR